eukprot:tig00020961_g16665.t1
MGGRASSAGGAARQYVKEEAVSLSKAQLERLASERAAAEATYSAPVRGAAAGSEPKPAAASPLARQAAAVAPDDRFEEDFMKKMQELSLPLDRRPAAEIPDMPGHYLNSRPKKRKTVDREALMAEDDEVSTPGRLTTKEAQEFLRLQREEPQRWTAEALAERFRLDVAVARDILAHCSGYVVLRIGTKNLALRELPREHRDAEAAARGAPEADAAPEAGPAAGPAAGPRKRNPLAQP